MISMTPKAGPLRLLAALLIAVLATGTTLALLAPGASAQEDDMLLLRTTAGDILAELHPEAAPITVAQISSLVDAGAYDNMPFVRVINGFVVQAGLVESHLTPPATSEQLGLVQNVPLETDPTYLHIRGVLSMARWDDPDSGTSSFSIVLGDFPHMDGEYTVFGRVIEGMAVADTLATIATDENDAPAQVISIWDAEIGPESELRSVDGFTTTPSAAAVESIESVQAVPGIATGSGISTDGGINSTRSTTPGAVAGLLGAMIFGVAAFLFADRLEPRFVGALGLLAALAAAFGLFVALVPSNSTLAGALFFIGMITFFRLLSRFESVGAPRPAPSESSADAELPADDTRPDSTDSGADSDEADDVATSAEDGLDTDQAVSAGAGTGTQNET